MDNHNCPHGDSKCIPRETWDRAVDIAKLALIEQEMSTAWVDDRDNPHGSILRIGIAAGILAVGERPIEEEATCP